jgi:hypothetical protein
MKQQQQRQTLDDVFNERADQSRREQALVGSFQSDDAVGMAFKEMCEKGCDPDWLKNTLLSLRHYPFERSKKSITDKDVQRMKRRVAELKKLSSEFPQFYKVIFLARHWSHWPIHPQLVSPMLSEIAYCLGEALEGGRWQDLVRMTAAHKLPHVMAQVKNATGRNMYRPMSKLVAAAYGIRLMSPDSLKTFVNRNANRSRRNASPPKLGKHK